MALHIVLVEPEIPPNTGNISRTCAATGTWLHLVKPLGFSIDDRTLKRAGLDYWPFVKVEIHESLQAFLEEYQGHRMWLSTTKGRSATRTYAIRTKTCCCSAGRPRAFPGISSRRIRSRRSVSP